MKTFPKKRIEIIVEAPLLSRVIALLDELDVSGYTVFPAIAGRGSVGSWHRDSSHVQPAKQILCIVDESREHEVLEPLFRLVSRQIGIITVSDVRVLRAEKFK